MTYESTASCESTEHIQRLEEIMANEKKEYGATGLRLFAVGNIDSSLEDVASEAVEMYDCFQANNFIDITNQEL